MNYSYCSHSGVVLDQYFNWTSGPLKGSGITKISFNIRSDGIKPFASISSGPCGPCGPRHTVCHGFDVARDGGLNTYALADVRQSIDAMGSDGAKGIASLLAWYASQILDAATGDIATPQQIVAGHIRRMTPDSAEVMPTYATWSADDQNYHLSNEILKARHEHDNLERQLRKIATRLSRLEARLVRRTT